MKLDDLKPHEQTALGGLIRLMIRSDGDFTEAEEATVEAIGNRLGGAGRLWSVISRSAQDCPGDEAIRAAAVKVERLGARAAILQVLEEVAAGDSVSDSERALLDWLRAQWA